MKPTYEELENKVEALEIKLKALNVDELKGDAEEAWKAFGRVLQENDKLEKDDTPAKGYLRGMLFAQAFMTGRAFQGKTIKSVKEIVKALQGSTNLLSDLQEGEIVINSDNGFVNARITENKELLEQVTV